MMKPKPLLIEIFLIAAVVLALLVLAGSFFKKASKPAAIQISENDAGKTIVMRVGDELVVSLPGTPATGYGWELEKTESSLLEQVGEIEYQSVSNLVGASAVMTMHLKATGPGQQTVRLLYRRPWEQGVEPLHIFELSIDVKPI